MTTYGQGADRGRARVAKPARRGAADLIPVGDETALLPQISDEEPPPPDPPGKKKRRAVRRHRDAGAGPGGGRKTFGDWVRTIVRGFGELFITLGVVILLFAAYEIWGKTAEINAHQDDLSTQLEQTWEHNPEAEPLPGDAMARLYIPKIKDKPWTIVEGTNWDDIKDAPGHYSKTQDPGEKGNFAVAGHNVPAIFRSLYDLEEGDKMVVETGESFYVYEVTKTDIVDPYAVEVIAPVPGKIDSKKKDAKAAMMTLTTCYPWYDNTSRWIVYGKLVDTLPRSEGIPPVATEK
ncbi:class E sortase [Phytomonospora endophytica]|uniref:Sortase A n=1 Tax=Phytomonospora endophytica TaxID=714109 RepID=A0A841FYD0_9ACTN|nr:class E sortase [Phytomonospora endophytica]MBB6038357.1 sortase A [Phytomonospora endophytica]GIG64287.1 hypothetical protein Pen01_05820 [Phytomonospora endophytica]